jgi:hypothetical protein
MVLAQAISDATNSSSLSWPAAVAIYLVAPLAICALIFGLVWWLSRPSDHDGSQVLGHPADMLRHERDPATGAVHPAARDAPAAAAQDAPHMSVGGASPAPDAPTPPDAESGGS